MARADKQTITSIVPTYYSDFYMNFNRNPITNILAIATNEDAVKQSLRTLVLTNFGERLYNPTIGSKVLASLFELQDTASEQLLKTLTEEAVAQEPRVNLLDVTVLPSYQDNTCKLSITFNMVNIPQQPVTMDLILKRIR